jgi:plasmid stabilization system protein ParE
MIERVIVRRLAKQDIREARSWYRKISPALGEDFMDALGRAIVVVREHPLAFQTVHRTFRRVLLHRFPYALFYHAESERIVIVALLHQARDPEILEQR